jgi:hypothetical protein
MGLVNELNEIIENKLLQQLMWFSMINLTVTLLLLLFGHIGECIYTHICVDNLFKLFKLCTNVTFEGIQQWSENYTCSFPHISIAGTTSPNSVSFPSGIYNLLTHTVIE